MLSGGSGGFSYTWAGSAATTQTISGLSPNTYSVTVTDQKGCTVQGSTSVATDPNTLTVNINTTDASCGQNNGSAVAYPSGSSIGATYLWSNGQTSSSASGLSVGAYQVTVTNASGCTATSSTNIGSSSGPSVSVSSFDATCYGINNGSAIASVSSTGNYSVAWSNGQTGSSATSLLAGTYYVTVTESGCQSIDTFTIHEPSTTYCYIKCCKYLSRRQYRLCVCNRIGWKSTLFLLVEYRCNNKFNFWINSGFLFLYCV
jgi:hypothetical protein